MAQTSCIILTPDHLVRLATIVGNRRLLSNHIKQAQIILCSDERLSVHDVVHRADVNRPYAWRSQQQAKTCCRTTRPPGKPSLSPD